VTWGWLVTSIRTGFALRFIALMLLAGRDFESFAGVNDKVMMLYFESVVARERKTTVLFELERRGFRRS